MNKIKLSFLTQMENMTLVTSDYDYYNTSDYLDDNLCDLDLTPEAVLTQTYFHSFICAFGLIGNALVIITYMFYKKTKTMTDVYLFNVALADLIFVAALPFIIYNEQHSWLMGSVACKTLRAAYSINLYCGMLLLACISCDRYIAIVQARRYFGAKHSHTLTYSRLTCTAVWVLAVVLSLPTLIYTNRFEEQNLGADSVTVCQLSFRQGETAMLIKVLVPSLQIVFGFLLPLLIMVFCYGRIVCTLLRMQSSQRHKAIRVVLAVVAVFILCHLPYNVTLLSHTLSLFKQRSCMMEQIKLQILTISRSVAYLHCCLNPFLYAFIGVKFRSHFRQIILDLWCFSKKYISNVHQPCAMSDISSPAHISTDSTVPSFSV